MDDLVARHRAKLGEIAAFWGWEIALAELRWHNDDELSLALWEVTRAGDPPERHWVITEPSGAVPVDSIPAAQAHDGRSALRRFGRQWAARVAQPIDRRVTPARLAEMLRRDPELLARDDRMRHLIGAAAALLIAFADEEE